MEIACDESGSEGEKLIGGQTDVFAHAGVRLSVEEAAECLERLRARIRSPALEYKANHLLRTKHRRVLEWFLGPMGPVHGKAHVHLVDKKLLLVNRLRELAGKPISPPSDELLAAFNDALRTKNRQASSESFFDLAAELGEPEELERRIENFRNSLDPLVPAIRRAIEYWSETGPVFLVHDEQPLLKGERLEEIESDPRLAGLRFVDSRTDARVQVADFLVGVARRIASDELNGRGDETLTALLRPYIDSASLWAGTGDRDPLTVPAGSGNSTTDGRRGCPAVPDVPGR